MLIVARILSEIIQIYSWILIIYILMSWVPNVRAGAFGQFLGRLCEPYLEPFRKIIPPIGGMLDISPIVAFLVLNFAQRGIYQIAMMVAG